MFEISETREMAASPEKVWRALTDFAAYGLWNPYVRVEGQAVAGTRVRYSFSRAPGRRAIVTDALILISDAPKRLEFDIGVPGLVQATNWYAVEAAPEGARVTHGLRFSGLLTFVAGAIARRMDRGYIVHPLDRLQRHLRLERPRARGTGSAAKGKRSPPRKLR
ncbi:SRPBCC family protein [Sphingomonas parva]|nr:SRPBCC family protein [Sphingomonas parva]